MSSLFAIGLILIFSGISPASQRQSLQLNHGHPFQFVGYYAALWQGFYEEQGIEVEIRSGKHLNGNSATEEVLAGRANFGVGGADILVANDREDSLMVICVILQKSSAEFYGLPGTKMDLPEDLSRLRVARNPNDAIDIEFQAMMTLMGVDPSTIPAHPHENRVSRLIQNQVDVIPGSAISTPYAAKVMGVNLIRLRPVSFGVDFYGDSLFALKKTINQDPGMVTRFKNASLKGWKYALTHPDTINESMLLHLAKQNSGMVFKRYNRFQRETIKELVGGQTIEMGHVDPLRWQQMHSLLKQTDLIKNDLDISSFIFTPPTSSKASKQILPVLTLTLMLSGLVLFFFYITTRSGKKKDSQQIQKLSHLNHALGIERALQQKTELHLKQTKKALDENQQTENRFHLGLQSLWEMSTQGENDLITLCNLALDEMKNITQSPYAFLGFLSSGQSRINCYTSNGRPIAKITSESKNDYPVYSTETRGIWSDAIREKKPILLNSLDQEKDSDLKWPGNSFKIKGLLSIPLYKKDRIEVVGIVANKPIPYTGQDVRNLKNFLTATMIVINQQKMNKNSMDN